MLGHQPLQLTHQPRLLADRKIGIDAILQRLEALLLQPRDRPLREAVIRELRQRRTAPQRQRCAQPLTRSARITGPQRAATLSDQRLKALDVDLAAIGRKRIPACARHHHTITQRLAQIRHVHLHGLGRGPARPLAPQRIDQAIGRDHLTAVQHQHRQQRPQLRPPNHQRPIAVDHLKRPKDPKQKHNGCPRQRYHRQAPPERPMCTAVLPVSNRL